MTTTAARPPARPAREGGRPRFVPRRKVCAFCVDKAESIDYKTTDRFGRYISDRGRIEPRRKTGTCARHQRMLAEAIKRARHLALLPFTQEHIRLTGVTVSRPPRAPYHGGPRHEAPVQATAPEAPATEAAASEAPAAAEQSVAAPEQEPVTAAAAASGAPEA